MERMWRKVSFGGGGGGGGCSAAGGGGGGCGGGGGAGGANNASNATNNRSNKHSISNINDTISSVGTNVGVSGSGGSGPFIDTQQYVSAVVASSSATGRRLASSGLMQQPSVSVVVAEPPTVPTLSSTATTLSTSNVVSSNPLDTVNVAGSSVQQQQQQQQQQQHQQQFRKSLSQHVLQTRSSSAERRRRRRRKSRTRRTGISCVGGGGDNMSSSGGFYTIKESSDVMGNSHHRYHHRSQRNSHLLMLANSAPTGTVMMYPNPNGRTELKSNYLNNNMSNANNINGNNQIGSTINSIAPTLVVATTTTTTAPTTTTAATGIGMGVGIGIGTAAGTGTAATPDISLRQRAVAKLRMFNFHLNWDLQMTHCKPCGSGSGNIITRRLCRNRRREDNELYRSNSFKFERFERKEYMEELADTLQKQIAICDDYSLPVDFVKKRPSSFDPCLAETLPPNPENWTAASPQQEFISFTDKQQQQQQQSTQVEPPPPPPTAASLSLLPSKANAHINVHLNADSSQVGLLPPSLLPPSISAPAQPLPPLLLPPIQTQNLNQPQHSSLQQRQQPLQRQRQQQRQQQHNKPHSQRDLTQQQQQSQSQYQQQQAHLVGGVETTNQATSVTIKQAAVKIIEGYSDPKDSKHHKKVYHKKTKKRSQQQQQPQQQQRHQHKTSPLTIISSQKPNNQHQQQQSIKQPQSQQPQQSLSKGQNSQDKRHNYSSDSSAPKSSDDEEEEGDVCLGIKVPELNSPDSISDDLVRPLPSQLHRSPRKFAAVNYNSNNSKRNPSPYYYSDLLKSKDSGAQVNQAKETSKKLRQLTASEPQTTTNQQIAESYQKSSSLDVPEDEGATGELDDEFDETETTNITILPLRSSEVSTPKRYSFTEDGVHIIRCDSPSTTTSDESDCSECVKRRKWHARALALVRKTCNVQPLKPEYGNIFSQETEAAQQLLEDSKTVTTTATTTITAHCSQSPSMPPHRLLGPAVCNCVTTENLDDELDEYFKPRSIFYVHAQGVHECSDCSVKSIKSLKGGNITSTTIAATATTITNDTEEDNMSGRTRQIYETAFDSKIAKSEDDLDEVDRITNHSVLIQLNNGNYPSVTTAAALLTKCNHSGKSRLEGKRLKNSKNQAIQQDQGNNSCGNQSGSGSSPLTIGGVGDTNRLSNNNETLDDNISLLTGELNNLNMLDNLNIDQQNNPTNITTSVTSSSQLPMRGYTPSPPSTAPLPMKFPGKHDRFFMNSIRSAPNLPSTNPAHPRLRDLRLPIQSNLRQLQPSSSLGTSNENSLTDSAFVNPPSSTCTTQQNNNHPHGHHSHHQHHYQRSVKAQGNSRSRSRPRSFVLESGRVLELRRSHNSHHHHQHDHNHQNRDANQNHHYNHHHLVSNNSRRPPNYSSTESIATSSSGGSLESLRSSTSEGNRSTSSSESRHSMSLSSHSSESANSSITFPLRAPVVIHSKLHILSPISDKSSQEPASELSEQNNKTQNNSPEILNTIVSNITSTTTNQLSPVSCTNINHPENIRGNSNPTQSQNETLKKRRPPHKTLIKLTDEILGSDSGISLHSREDGKPLIGLQKFTLPKLNFPSNGKVNANDINTINILSNSSAMPQDLRDLPFDMPKLRRRKTLQQDACCTSGSATSVDLGDLPFDMPKLRRRLRANQTEINNLMMLSTESSGISQASSSHSMRDNNNKTANKLDIGLFRQNLTLNLNEQRSSNTKFGSLDLKGLAGQTKELNLNFNQNYASAVDLIDISIPLERQGWYHGAITRIEAETTLRPLTEGSFLVRNCESTKQDYSLSLKGAKGFMHMRIQRNDSGQYILGQFSRPFDTVPDMIRHFCLNRLPVRGAEHMCLIEPVIAQLL